MYSAFARRLDEELGRFGRRSLCSGVVVVLGLVIVTGLITPHVHMLRFFVYAAPSIFGFLGCACLATIAAQLLPSRQDRLKILGIGSLVIAFVAWAISPSQAHSHPLFNTRLTVRADCRSAIQVDVLDDSEGPFGGKAELYLAVQSSRSPESVRLIFPVNRGDFIGCRSRFIQLPFEVEDGDMLLFNLLDEDELSVEEEKLLLGACQAGGYCLEIGSAIFRPDLVLLAHPGFRSAADVIGKAMVLNYHENPFENYGVGEYIVEPSRPRAPNLANRVTLVQAPSHARANVRVYFPSRALE